MAQQKSRTQQLNGLPALAYVGVQPSSPQNFIIKQSAPTTNDYRNVYVGDLWLDNSSMYPPTNTAPTVANLWILVSVKSHVATWRNFGSGMGTVITLTGDVGGPVGPDGLGNINTLGTANAVLVTGNPGANTLTWSLDGSVAQQFNEDSGTAIPVLGILNILGTGGIATSGAGNTVTIDGSGIVTTLSFPTDNGTAVPAAGLLNIIANVAALNCGSSVLFDAPGPSNTVQLNVTDSDANTIIGFHSGNLTFTGTNSTGLGEGVLGSLTTASNCVSIGHASSPAITTSPSNVVVGQGSATLLATGAGLNTIIGQGAATAIVTGTGNFIGGAGAGTAFTLADSNSVVINGAGQAGRSGLLQVDLPTYGTILHNYPGQASAVNGENYFFGLNAGNFTMNPTGTVANIGIGGGALNGLVSGVGGNISIGDVGMFHLTTGVQNTGVGVSNFFNAGSATGLITGSNNVALGFDSGKGYTGAESFNILIANQGTTGESNTTRIGENASINRAFFAGIRGATTGVNDAIAVLIDSAGQLGTASSSARYKENIEDMGCDSNVLHKLRPVSFKYKKHPAGSKSVGLIAEEVAVSAPELVVYDKDGIPETVRYNDLVPMLLNEVIKLNKRIEKLERE